MMVDGHALQLQVSQRNSAQRGQGILTYIIYYYFIFYWLIWTYILLYCILLYSIKARVGRARPRAARSPRPWPRRGSASGTWRSRPRGKTSCSCSAPTARWCLAGCRRRPTTAGTEASPSWTSPRSRRLRRPLRRYHIMYYNTIQSDIIYYNMI